MSKIDGPAALNLDMPGRVPRTEYSAHFHWELIKKVTGIEVDSKSLLAEQTVATNAFVKAWNYDFMWNIWVHSHNSMNGFYTKMGHAEYAAGAVDFSNDVNCPFKDPEDILEFRPTQKYGKIDKDYVLKKINDDFHMNEKNYPDAASMTGSYVSCVSGLIEMFGWEMLLMAMGIDGKAFGDVTIDYGKHIMQYFEVLAKCDSDIIMIHDDLCWTSGAIFAPEWYREYVFPIIKQEVKILKDCNKKVLFTSDGDYTMFVDDVANCGVDGFVLEPITDMKYIAEKYGKTHVIVGNVDTRILLSKGKEDIYNEVKRCMDIGKKCPGYFMAVGNHIPSNTPVENALYYNEIYEKLSKR